MTLITTTPGCRKIIPLFFFKVGPFICAESSRFGPLRLLAPVLVPPGPGIIPCQGAMGTTTNVGTPPLSIASDTRHSSPRTPHQCRTLARCLAPRTQSPQCSSAKGVATLHNKGVLRFSFLRRIHTPSLRTALRVNKVMTPPLMEIIG